MAKRYEVPVTVYRVERGNVSTMGNPSYVFHTDRGLYKTMSNASCSYRLENDFSIRAMIDRDITLIVTEAGRVTSWKL